MNERDYAVKVKLKMHVEKGINDNWQTITKKRKEMRIAEHIKNIFEEDGMLSQYITGNLEFLFYKTRKFTVKFQFDCATRSKQEAEKFVRSCIDNIREYLEEDSYFIDKIRIKPNRMEGNSVLLDLPDGL